jgi:hypothetical protein
MLEMLTMLEEKSNNGGKVLYGAKLHACERNESEHLARITRNQFRK